MHEISLASVGLDNPLSSIPVISAFFTNWTLFKGKNWENPPWYSCLVVIKVSFIQFKRDVIRNNFPSQIKRPWFSEFISTLWEEVPKKIDFIVGLANMDFKLVLNFFLNWKQKKLS
jgi:hypothetical protein